MFKFNPQKGFTILEVVVTLFIVGVTMTIFIASSNALVLNKNLRHQETALRIANKKIQELRKIPFDDLPASGTFSDSLLTSIPSGSAELTYTSESSFLKKYTIVVGWTPPGRPSQSVTLESLFTKGGIGK